jgi:hypothetical protein
MKTRSLVLIVTASVAITFGVVVKLKHTSSHETIQASQGSAPKDGKKSETVQQSQPSSQAAMPESPLAVLKVEMSHLSDAELNQVVAHSGGEIKKRIAADPTGAHRSEAETMRIALELDREAAARLLLIDRKLDSIKGMVL